MKKIGYISVDSSELKLLLANLPESALKKEIENLSNGNTEVLMLENASSDFKVDIPGEIRCDKLIIREKARVVEMDGSLVSLTPKEFDILLFLAKNRGVVFTKEQIYNAVWQGEYLMDDSNIMAFIRKLRKKIEPNPDAPEYILTVWGIGYKFNDKK